MKTLRIEIGKTTYNLSYPESYNELSQFQFVKVAELFLLPQKPLRERVDDQLRLLFFLLSGATPKAKAEIVKETVRSGDAENLLSMNVFLSDRENFFNAWAIKKIVVDKRVELHGPQDSFNGLVFGEFIACEMLCDAYLKSNKPELLNDFCAVLFRKAKAVTPEYSGDRRMPYDSNFQKYYSNLFRDRVDELTKTAILHNYLGVRHWLESKYPFVFPKPIEGSQQNPKNVESPTWLSIRKGLANGVLNLEKIDNLLLHDVLRDFNENIKTNSNQ